MFNFKSTGKATMASPLQEGNMSSNIESDTDSQFYFSNEQIYELEWKCYVKSGKIFSELYLLLPILLAN